MNKKIIKIIHRIENHNKRKEPSSSTSSSPAKKKKLTSIPEKRKIQIIQNESTPLPKKSRLGGIRDFLINSAIGQNYKDYKDQLPSTSRAAQDNPTSRRDSGYSCAQSPTQNLPDDTF